MWGALDVNKEGLIISNKQKPKLGFFYLSFTLFLVVCLLLAQFKLPTAKKMFLQ